MTTWSLHQGVGPCYESPQHARNLSFSYLDNILLMAPSWPVLATRVQQVLPILTLAGFVINLQKSSLTPSQDKVFLGARFQSVSNLTSLPWDKAWGLQTLVASFHLDQSYPTCCWLVFLDVLASVLPMFPFAQLQMRFI